MEDGCVSSKSTDFQKAIQDIRFDVLVANGNDDFEKEFQKLFNLIEAMGTEILALRKENQELKDEINRLKGEQGKPDVRPKIKSKDISSEAERKKIKKRK